MAGEVPTFGEAELWRVSEALGLQTPVSVVVIIGGAAKLDSQPSASSADTEALATLRADIERTFVDALRPAVRQTAAVVLTGGTDAGVMRIAGRALADAAALIGVVPGRMVTGDDRMADLDKNHSAAVLTDGATWGSETEVLFELAELLTGGTAPGVVLLANGGDVSFEEARRFLRGGWPIVTVTRSGGAAQDLMESVSKSEPGTEWGDLHQADVEALARDRVLARRQLVWRLHPDELLKTAWATFASYDEQADSLKAAALRTRRWLTGLSSLLLVAITATVQFAVLDWTTAEGEVDPGLGNEWLRSGLPALLDLLKWTVLALPIGIAVAVMTLV